MNYRLFCKPEVNGLDYCINSTDDDAVKDSIRELFRDEIDTALASYAPIACGYFDDLTKIEEGLYTAAKNYLTTHFMHIVLYIQEIDETGELINETSMGLDRMLHELVDDRQGWEQSTIDVSYALLRCLASFIKQGVWQFGLRDEDGHIITNPSSWPKPRICGNTVEWHDESRQLTPILWFGLMEEEPLMCWTLCKSSWMFEIMDYREPYNVERWKSFWFNRFWSYDWNTLLGLNASNYITWMFSECGMEEPYLGDVISTCPIVLDEHDSPELLKSKLDAFFLQQ